MHKGFDLISDTSPEFEQLQIERLRAATPTERLQLMVGMSRMVTKMSRSAIARLHPDWTEQQRAKEYVRVHYGESVASLMRQE